MRMNEIFSFILIHSPFFRFFPKKWRKGRMNENEWDYLIHSHSFSLFHFFPKKWRKGRMNENE